MLFDCSIVIPTIRYFEKMKRIAITLILSFLLSLSAAAQQNKARAEKEIVVLRQTIAAAIGRKDQTALARIFADDFVHTHATGKIDGKNQRLAGVLDGEPNIESVAPEEMRVRTFGKNTAVAHGRTRIAANGKEIVYQWTAVYFKQKGRWRVAATQATALAPTK